MSKRLLATALLVALLVVSMFWVPYGNLYWIGSTIDFVVAAILLFGWVFRPMGDVVKRLLSTAVTLVVFWVLAIASAWLGAQIPLVGGNDTSVGTIAAAIMAYISVTLSFVVAGWMVGSIARSKQPRKHARRKSTRRKKA